MEISTAHEAVGIDLSFTSLFARILGSALDLAPPICIIPLRMSVLCSERMGLKRQLIRGPWFTQASGREGYNMQGEPVVIEAGMRLQ